MGPDPFNMPSAGNPGQALQQSVNQLAPMATQYHGPAHGVPIAQATPTSTQSKGGVLSQFAHFIGGIGGEIGHISGGAASWLAKNTVNAVEAPVKFGANLGHTLNDNFLLNSVHSQSMQLNAQVDTLNHQFRAGQISSHQYQAALNDINKQYGSLSQEQTGLQNKLNQAASNTKVAGIDTVSTLVTILTTGLGSADSVLLTKAGLTPVAAKTTADYLTSTNANAFLGSVEQGISKLASDPGLFAKLTPEAQKAIQSATAEVVSTGARMSAPQIAQASAVNLALKYPVYYNYLSSTGSQIYKELDNKKYGDATRTIAFNAALLLSGGPIGQALKYGGKAVGGVGARTFSRTPFLDELSKGIGSGDPAGLFKAVIKLPESERGLIAKDLSAVEATNLQAASGDPVAAAWRVLNGMGSYEGLSMNQFTHDEALNNMVNFARAQRIASEAASRAGLPDITVGRVDARALNEISANLSQLDSKASRLQAWEGLKSSNPNQAWANNENFDRQVKNLIGKYESPAELDNALRGVKASFKVDGISKNVSKQLAKMGYIPIKPAGLEAPFKEGTGKITSSFAKNDDIFHQAVRPLPILGWLGGAVSAVGLSPYASTQRVYQLFNENLARNLEGSGIVKKISGEELSSQTDSMIKQLSSYAHEPTAGKIFKRAPITDLRMLTTKDVETALGVGTKDAKAVQKSITRAFLQVPLATRGLGDKLVDATYPALRRYLRVQGAVRFSWNPFFQYLRVIPKTEFLSETEGGGVFRSMFAGRLGEINKIRTSLRESGMLDESGHLGNVVSGEAIDYAGAISANLSKRLLPMQERSIAGLIDGQARRMGVDSQTYIQEFPQQVRDTIQSIAQYDRHSQFLNSPLARTLNIAVFPFRFDAKVLGIMTRSLGRSSLLTQVSVINGLMRAHDWLNSPEGMAWYSQNSETIGLFKYVSPIATFGEVFNSLLPGHDHSLGNFGELGGLPFGFIPQILDSEGLTHFNQTGVNPKTGAIYPQYLPVTSRGQVAIAVQDFLGTLFSYPGATVGLPSKTSLTRMAAMGITGANKKTDLGLSTPAQSALSPQQQQYSEFVQKLSGTSAQHLPSPAPLSPGVNVPATASLPSNKGPLKQTTKTTRLKKSQFKPELLPGQTQYGQL